MPIYSPTTPYPAIDQLLTKRFNILDRLEVFNYFQWDDYDGLNQWFVQNTKDTFAHNERFVVCHYDTDYYIGDYGVHLNNFFNMWKQHDFPIFTMIFCTNHHGISKEINKICQYTDKPKIIESSLNFLQYPDTDQLNNSDIQPERIVKHAVCLSGGTARSHRFALYNQLADLVPDKIGYSIKKNK